MSRVAYVNGQFLPHRDAGVHVEDRGYQFADGVYEVVAVVGGAFFDLDGHLDRLARSLRELAIVEPMSRRAFSVVMAETVRRNQVQNGIIYIQITRGVARRDHAFPANARPSVVMTARNSKPIPSATVAKGVGVITIPDMRWDRCDIKSVGLLPNILGKQAARQAGAFEAVMIDAAGMVTEGTSTNVWIVTAAGELITRNTGNAILNGITRLAVLDLARDTGVAVVERPFSLAEAKAAREVFVSSTTALLMPVVKIDGQMVGDGKPGALTLKLREAYCQAMAAGGRA